MTAQSAQPPLQKTAFHALHLDAGARMVSFAGYDMPVQYHSVKAEHLHTRSAASLFDVSHMGQLLVSGETAQQELEALLPVDLDTLDTEQMCLTFLTNDEGGILDDLIVTRRSDTEFALVVNGAVKQRDIAHIRERLERAELLHFEQQALLALQGPEAEAALCSFLPDTREALEALTFMRGIGLSVEREEGDFDIYISRSGYSGEDGFEISMPNEFAVLFARGLLDQDAVQWAGLGARDTLRLEAGLCLYGHDLDTTTTPIEAGFLWSIDKSRRSGGSKAGGFPGAERILEQIEQGVQRRRRGLRVLAKVPVREGATLFDADGTEVGRVTSGGPAPSLDALIAMAYIDTAFLERADADTAELFAEVRGRRHPVKIEKMPFFPPRYRR